MDRSEAPRWRAGLTIAVAATITALLAWQQFHGGVPSHSFMARVERPSISSWSGALTLPLLPWFALVVPRYRAEYLLGFVLALTYPFGGVLPPVIGTVIAATGAVPYPARRRLLGRFRVKR